MVLLVLNIVTLGSWLTKVLRTTTSIDSQQRVVVLTIMRLVVLILDHLLIISWLRFLKGLRPSLRLATDLSDQLLQDMLQIRRIHSQRLTLNVRLILPEVVLVSLLLIPYISLLFDLVKAHIEWSSLKLEICCLCVDSAVRRRETNKCVAMGPLSLLASSILKFLCLVLLSWIEKLKRFNNSELAKNFSQVILRCVVWEVFHEQIAPLFGSLELESIVKDGFFSFQFVHGLRHVQWPFSFDQNLLIHL